MKEHLLNSYVKFAEFLVHALGSCFGAAGLVTEALVQ